MRRFILLFVLTLGVCVEAQNVPRVRIRVVSPITTITPAGVQIPAGTSPQSIIDAHSAGTTYVFMSGTHRLDTFGAFTPKTGDTFDAQYLSSGTRLAVISGARVLSSWTQSGAVWYATGQTQEGTPGVDPGNECKATHPMCIYPEDVFFDNAMKFRESSLGAVGAGEWYFDYAADRIYVGDDPAGHVVETSVIPGVVVPSGADNVTFKHMIVEKFAAFNDGGLVLSASGLGGENWLADGVEARWNHGTGVYTDSFSTVQNSYLHNNCGYGVKGAGESILVSNNEIAYNNRLPQSNTTTCGYNPYWGAGTKWVYTTGLVVTLNYVHHNDSPGLWTDINNITTEYSYNTVDDNEYTGIFHEISYAAIIHHNLIRNNGKHLDFPGTHYSAGISVASSPDVEVYENLLENNQNGITGLDDDARGTGLYGAWNLINLYVHNNGTTSLVSDAGFGRTGVIDYADGDAFTMGANNRFFDNDYVAGPQADYFFWNGMEYNETEWFVDLIMDENGSFTRVP